MKLQSDVLRTITHETLVRLSNHSSMPFTEGIFLLMKDIHRCMGENHITSKFQRARVFQLYLCLERIMREIKEAHRLVAEIRKKDPSILNPGP